MRVLDGMQVVELAGGVAGPIAGMFLADFGAEVVKVEPPDGDPGRTEPGSVMWNRGKKSVVADPADPDRRAWLGRLIAGADVCVVNTEDDLSRYGLGTADLRAAAPRLIVLVVAPYTAASTPWLGERESHGLLAAATGMAWRQASNDGGPVEMVAPQFLYVHGVWAAACAAAALVERETSGLGQAVTVTGVNAVMEGGVSQLTIPADSPDPDTAIGSGGRHPTYTRYQTGDGKWLGVGGLGPKFELLTLRVLGLEHIVDDPRMGGQAGLLQAQNYEWVSGAIAEAFRGRDRAHWLARLAEQGIPCGPLEDPAGWLDDPQVTAIGMRAETVDPVRGPVTMPGIPVHLTRTPAHPPRPAPALGAHDGEVTVREPHPGGPPRARLSAGPLAGYRVLDQGTFVAGPYTGCLLAELGASVIKVEPPGGDPFRANGYTFNRGMRSLAVDLKSPAGQDVFHRLARDHDVVVTSLRPGVARELNIDHDTLAGINPSIVTASLSAYGAVGPMAQLPGVDMVIQAMSGMMRRQGGAGEPVSNTIAIIDTTTGAMGALLVSLALLHRERTGEGQPCWYSLMATATYLQSGELVRYAGRPAPPMGGPDHRGGDPFDRFYAAADGWIRLQATGPVRASDLTAAGIDVDEPVFAADPGGALEKALAGLGAADAVAALGSAGIPAVRARKIGEAVRDEDLLGEEFVHVRTSEDGPPILTPGRYATFSRTQRHGPMPVPGTGEHTVEVLRAAGLTEAEVEELVAAGVVVRGGPMPQRLTPIYR